MNVLQFGIFAAFTTVCCCDSCSIQHADGDMSVKLSCVVLNAVSMNCHWSAVDTSQATTNYQMFFNANCDRSCSKCRDIDELCPLPSHNKCIWPQTGIRHFRFLQEYCLRLVGHSAQGTTMSIWTVPIRRCVKPAAMSSLQVVNKTSTSLFLVWSKPEFVKQFEVRLNCTSHCTNSSLLLNGQTHANVTNLVPSMEYRLSVEIRPLLGGFWSDASWLNVSTSPDVAGENPTLSPGLFTTDDYDSQTRIVTIFWQPVPVCRRHDVNYNVVVQYRAVDDVTTAWQTHVVDGSRPSVKLKLSSRLNYELSVKSQTSAGFNTSLPVELLYITAHKWYLNVTSLRNGSTITTSWSHVLNSVRYTIYMCNQTLTCQSPVMWRHVNSSLHSWSFNLSPHQLSSLMIAVSAEFMSPSFGLFSSGMQRSRCVFDVNAPVAHPSNIQPVLHDAVLTVTWQHPACHQTSYIHTYLVQFCNNSTTECQSVPVTSSQTRVEVDASSSDDKYCVQIMSLSSVANSSLSQPVCALHVSHYSSSVNNVQLVIVFSVIGLLICIILAVILYFKKKVAIMPPAKVEVDFSHSEASNYGPLNSADLQRPTAVEDASSSNSRLLRHADNRQSSNTAIQESTSLSSYNAVLPQPNYSSTVTPTSTVQL